MKFDLSAFKKVKEDNHSAVLKHPHGHQITISKNGLSQKLKSDLAGLPMHMYSGGSADDAAEIPNNESVPTQEQEGGVKYNLPFGITATYTPPNEPVNQAPVPTNLVASNESEIPSGVTPIRMPAQIAPQNYSITPSAASGVNPEMAQPNKAQAPYDFGMGAYGKDIGNYQAGIYSEAKAMGEQGKQEAIAAQQQQQQAINLENEYKKHSEELTKERAALLKDYGEGHINPNHYMENKSALGKVGTAIGLILGGIGGGLTKQGNPALEFLNHQINRDIEAQKADLGKKENLLSANLKQFGNLKDATDMTRIMQADIYSAKLKEAAAKVMDPVARAKALQAASHFDLTVAQPLLQQLALKRSVMSGMGTGGVDPSVAVRYVVDESHQPKAYEEVKQQQNINAMNKNAIDSFDKVSMMQNTANRALNPLQSSSQINAEWEPMMDKLTKNTEGRVTPITIDLMNSLKPAISDSPQTLAIKRQKLMNILNSERSTPTLDAYGIKIPKNIGMARPNTNAPQGYNLHASTRK